MRFGGDYSRFYDTFYQEKDYRAEARFVLSRLAALVPQAAPMSILDLGCGTGRHAVEFARSGHRVSGVDLSPQMLGIAAARLRDPESGLAGHASFQVGDVRDVQLGMRFDAIFCLFHVLCYLPEPDDIRAAFDNARRHAKPGAAYLFDFWQGAAVLASPPTAREKVVTIGSTVVRRVSRPKWDRAKSLVEINYTIEMTDRVSGQSRVEEERHLLRYLFPGEVREWLTASGFEVIEIGEWMTARPPDDGSFSVYALARAV